MIEDFANVKQCEVTASNPRASDSRQAQKYVWHLASSSSDNARTGCKSSSGAHSRNLVRTFSSRFRVFLPTLLVDSCSSNDCVTGRMPPVAGFRLGRLQLFARYVGVLLQRSRRAMPMFDFLREPWYVRRFASRMKLLQFVECAGADIAAFLLGCPAQRLKRRLRSVRRT